MEVLAYLHHACANESEEPETQLSDIGLRLLSLPNWQKFSGKAALHVLSLVVGLSMVTMANAAMALLQKGDSGPEVSDLQATLARLNYFQTSPTGYFGSTTEAAVMQFQRQQGLTPDGIVGPATQTALRGGYVPVSTGSAGRSDTSTQALQQKLQELGYYQGSIDGIYGPQTRDAVIRLQTARGITVDGQPGPQTWAEIDKCTLAGSCVQTAYTFPPDSPSSAQRSTWGSSYSRVLQLGAQGADVIDLQTRLRDLKFYNGPIDGNFNWTTADAVRRFQASRGLVADGVVGAQTRQALLVNLPPVAQRNRYIVVIPNTKPTLLAQVKQYVYDASPKPDRRGAYIQAGAFPTQEIAENRSQYLRGKGLDARVEYQ